jgi:hypothetical protein
MVIVALAVVGLFAAGAYVGGVGLDYVAGGDSVRSFLEKQFGRDARYVSIHLQSGYMHANTIGPGNTIVGKRFDGRSARSPDSPGKATPEEVAQAFSLDDVDFDVVEEVVRHARERQPDGELKYILLGRSTTSQADVLWAVHMEVGGEYQRWLYDLEGKPLVDDVRNYLAPKAEWFAAIEKRHGARARLVRVLLTPTHADFEVMTAKSERDTDTHLLGQDGEIGVPRPATSNADPASLKAKSFAFGDIDWKAVSAAITDAKKTGEGEVQSVSIDKNRGTLAISISVKNARGVSRSVAYDAKGKRSSGE